MGDACCIHMRLRTAALAAPEEITSSLDPSANWNFRLATPIFGAMIRRPVGLFVEGLFAFQLLLAGASNFCPMWDHGSAASDAGAAATHVEMNMPGMPMDDAAPCDHPVSPEQCQTMAPCASAFLVVAIAEERSTGAHTSGVLAAMISVPRSISFTPEPPPPRA